MKYYQSSMCSGKLDVSTGKWFLGKGFCFLQDPVALEVLDAEHKGRNLSETSVG